MTALEPIDLLRRAAADRLSGSVRLHVGAAQVGLVFFVDGHVVWATCREQRETLGTFLWRLGHITRRQLEIVGKVFEGHQGRKKFGQLLEELGLMPRPILRRCLLLHTREALRTLLACRGVVCTTVSETVGVTDDTLFALDEVLPFPDALGAHPVGPPALAPTAGRGGGEPIELLFEIPDYLACAVVSAQGEVLTGHATRCGQDLVPLGIFAGAAADGAERLVASGGLGPMGLLSIGSTSGRALIRWVDEAKRYLVVVLVGGVARQAEAEAVIEAALPSLRRWISNTTVATFFRELVEKAASPREQVQALRMAIRVRLRELRMEGCSDRNVARLEDALDLVNDGKLGEAAVILGDADSRFTAGPEMR
jgi:hypothetical protein